MTIRAPAEMRSPFFGNNLTIIAVSIRPVYRAVNEARTTTGCEKRWKLRTFHFGFLAYLLSA
ncbi:MAG: hypothetical protein ABSH11_05980 [Verrucomicrobiota bacterium]|jgi:hypothetical protein